MTAMLLRLKGAERSISSANNVDSATVVRVINTGAAAVLNVAYANGTVYANCTVSNTQFVIVEKNPSDTVTGANMLAVQIAYRN